MPPNIGGYIGMPVVPGLAPAVVPSLDAPGLTNRPEDVEPPFEVKGETWPGSTDAPGT
jgi:hypothetical protein